VSTASSGRADNRYAIHCDVLAGYRAGGQTYVRLFDAGAPPILEVTHESPIQRCRKIIGTAPALQQYVAKFFANSALPAGVLTLAGR
jgi:hypothetical protein